jgi:hypothetical protein
VKIYSSILLKSMNSIKNFNINFTNLKSNISLMKVHDLKVKPKLMSCSPIRKKNQSQNLIMLTIKIIELDAAFITLLVKKFSIIIAKNVAVKQEVSAFLSANALQLVKLKNWVVHAEEKMIAETKNVDVSKTIKNASQAFVKVALIVMVFITKRIVAKMQ